MAELLVAALYKFTPIDDPGDLREPLFAVCQANNVKGSLLLAHEGINGTIAGTDKGVRAVLAWISRHSAIGPLEHKQSKASAPPFLRMKVRLKKEIVTLGVADADPSIATGTFVDPADWNALITQPDVVLIDTRNDYEVEIGSFANAIDPKTASFGDFPRWLADNHDQLTGRKIAMFCTGGIRCEKASALLKARGYNDVFQLKGGILKYLETVPESKSAWHGECFVFDQRVAVGPGLVEGSYALCHACRRPLSTADLADKDYQLGVSCGKCIHQIEPQKRQGFAERQRQVELAKLRSEPHLGSDQAALRNKKRLAKAAHAQRSNAGQAKK